MRKIPPLTLDVTEELQEQELDTLDSLRVLLSNQVDQYEEQALSAKGIGQEDAVNLINTRVLWGEVCRVIMAKDMEYGH